MADLKNKNLIKVMWLPGEDGILFSMKDEKPLPLKAKSYATIVKYVDIGNWVNLYSEGYNSWLNKDEQAIYDINNPVNLMMINALIKANKAIKDEMIFYWFDIDRTYNESFKWEYCPISKKKLICLEDNYPTINSFVSPDYPLVFPGNL